MPTATKVVPTALRSSDRRSTHDHSGGGGHESLFGGGGQGASSAGAGRTGPPPPAACGPADQSVSPNTHTSSVMVTTVMSTIPMRLSHTPPRTIWPMVTYPDP